LKPIARPAQFAGFHAEESLCSSTALASRGRNSLVRCFSMRKAMLKDEDLTLDYAYRHCSKPLRMHFPKP
jgi:hypothetical protein